jgi:transporter family-2 protein
MGQSSLWFILAAFLAGTALPIQAGANAELGRVLGHPLSAAIVSAFVGIGCVLLTQVLLRAPVPSLSTLGAAPRWSWIGGVMGVAYLVLAIMSVPKLGTASFAAIAIAGQMTCALLIDHFAWMGVESRPASLGRIAGVGLVLIGVALVQFSGASNE